MPGPVRWLCAALVTAIAVVLFSPASAGAAGTLRFTFTADTYVTEHAPSASYGTEWGRLRVDDAPDKIGYVKFQVSGIPTGMPVTSATLTLTAAGSQTAQAVDVHAVTNSWTESTTYTNRPRLGGKIGSATIGNGAPATLTVPVTGNGTVSFAVVRASAGGDNVIATRENGTAAHRPQLVVEYGQDADASSGPGDTSGTAPAPSPSPTPTATPTPIATTSPSPTPSPTGTATSTQQPAPGPSPSGGNPFIAYSPDSFFRSPLPSTGVPVASDSAAGISYINANDPRDYPAIRGVQDNWGMVYAMGDCNDPVWKIGAGKGPSQWASLRTTGFHAPADLGPFTGTSDSPFVVIDTCTGVSLWAHQASLAAGTMRTINVTTFGTFDHDSNGLDRRNPLSDSNVNERSRGVIPDSMVIRDDLMAAAMAGPTAALSATSWRCSGGRLTVPPGSSTR